MLKAFAPFILALFITMLLLGMMEAATVVTVDVVQQIK